MVGDREWVWAKMSNTNFIPTTSLMTPTDPVHNDLNRSFYPGQTVPASGPYAGPVHQPQFDFSALQQQQAMNMPDPMAPPQMPGSFDPNQFSGGVPGVNAPPLPPMDPTQMNAYDSYYQGPQQQQDMFQGPQQQDEDDAFANYLASVLQQKQKSPEEQLAEQNAIHTRLQSMLPMPEPPRKTDKWEKIGAAFGDVGNALGTIEQGFHPTIGSGRRRRIIENRVQPTNYLGQLRATEEARKHQYERDVYNRGLIEAQMTPTFEAAGRAEEDKLNQQKLAAAIAYLNAEAKKDKSGRRQNTFMSTHVGLFYDANGNFQDSNEIYQTFIDGYTQEVSPDPKRAELAYKTTRGLAAINAQNAQSARESKEANEENLKSITADRRKAAGVAGEQSIAQHQQYLADKGKFVQNGLAEDAAMFKANAAKVYTPGEKEKFDASRRNRIKELGDQYDQMYGVTQGQTTDQTGQPTSQPTGNEQPQPARTINDVNPSVKPVLTQLYTAYKSKDIATLKQILHQGFPELNPLMASDDEILTATKDVLRKYMQGGQ